MDLKVGDLVEVLSEEEILATLDENGEHENLPFQPEMLRFCGSRLTVDKIAHKTCDLINPGSGLRRSDRTVHLTGARCDGSAHGGCQNMCMFFWKDAWLRKVAASDPATPARPSRKLLPLLEVAARKPPVDGVEIHRCQATELARSASVSLPFKEMGQYVTDARNVGVAGALRGGLIGFYNRLQDTVGQKLPRALQINGGRRFRLFVGTAVGRTPAEVLDLKVGERVRIKSRAEIVATLNEKRLNRGMVFEEESARHCGKTATVIARVDRVVDERSGRMLIMKTPSVILDNIVCEGFYNRNCPRQIVTFWREIWLERVEEEKI